MQIIHKTWREVGVKNIEVKRDGYKKKGQMVRDKIAVVEAG